MKSVARVLQQRFPHITVEPTTWVYADLVQKLPVSFAGDAPPDSFNMDMLWVQEYGPNNWVLDLNERLKRDKNAYGNGYRSAPLGKLAFEIMSWKQALLGMPTSTAPNLFFYNANMFRRAGLKTPHELYKEDKWTWEAFLEAAQRLTVRQGDKLEVAGFEQGLHRLWINAAGSQEFDSYQAPTRCLYNSPQAIEALRFLQDSRQKQRVQPVSFAGEIGVDATQGLIQGRVAMMARWDSGIPTFKNIDGFKWSMVPYPKRRDYAVDYATSGMALAKAGKALDAAWTWSNFLAGPEGGREEAVDGNNVYFNPETQTVSVEAHRKMTMLETPGANTEIQQLGKYNHVRLISKSQASIQREFINPAMTRIWRGEQSPEAATQAFVAQLDAWLKQNPQ